MMKTNNKEWSGYTFDELQQAIAKQRFNNELDRTRIVVKLSILRSGINPASGSTYRKLLGALNIADYAVLGIKAVKIFRRFFKQKKQ
jgi:hypothetical protein